MGDKTMVHDRPADERVMAPARSTPSPAAARGPLEHAGGGSTAAAMAAMRVIVPSIQAKLRVGSSVDPAEHEADAVADRVVALLRRPEHREGDGGSVTAPIEAAAPVTRIRRAAFAVRRQAEAAVGAEGGDIDGALAAGVQHASGGSALDSKIKPRLEGAFGTTFDDVRIHRDSAIAPRIGARAFTFGNAIHFAPGEYNPSSTAGMHVLSHELTHVVQQSGGAAHASRIARATTITERPVVRRTAKLVWGKWKSTHDMNKIFANEAECRTWDAAQETAAATVVADDVDDDYEEPGLESEYVWDVVPSSRNHYNDGWGATYGVRTDAQLKQKIADDDNSDAGNQEVYLGDQKVGTVLKGCNILYSNTWVGTKCTTRVWHCGPTLGAG